MTLSRSAGTVLLAATLVVSLAVVGHIPASQDAAAQQDSYVVEQGNRCEVITPLSGEETGSELYDYRHHGTHEENYAYSSHGTTGLQQNDVTSVFLYRGPDGLSFVTVHDRLGGGTGGGAAEFRMVGLPTDSEWTVQDDDYSEHIDDVWRHGDVWSDVAWLWGESRTDGGVVTGLGNDFAVTINPAFNDQQSTFNQSEIDGSIRELHVLSGDAEQPERTSLANTRDPFVIRTGTCDDPTVQYERIEQGVSTPVEDETGEQVGRTDRGGILATVEDTGGEPVTLRPPATAENGVQYDQLSVVASGAETWTGPGNAEIGMRVEEPTEIPESDGNALSMLSVETTEGSVDDSTLTFGVRDATLEQHNATVNDVTVYEETGDGWQRASTAPMGTSSDATQFETNTSADGQLAVVLEESPVRATELTLSEERIDAGESVEVTAMIENTGDVTETELVSMHVLGEAVGTQEVTLEPGATETLTFERQIDSSGTHTVEVAGETRQIDVEGDGPAGTMGTGDYLTIGVGTFVLVALALWWRRSPEE